MKNLRGTKQKSSGGNKKYGGVRIGSAGDCINGALNN